MAQVTHKPVLDATATVLREAIERSGLSRSEIGRRLRVSSTTVQNMAVAKTYVDPAQARALGKILGVDPATILSPGAPPTKGRPQGKQKKSKRRTAPGPAARAVALHAATSPALNGHAVLPPSRSSPGVFGMEMAADGEMKIWLRATLPYERGVRLLRMLLDEGLAPGTDGQGPGDSE